MSCCCPSSVKVISMPATGQRCCEHSSTCGAKILPQLARWSTVPRCSCLFSTAHPHNETASLRQFALTQHSGGACRCSSCTSKHWGKWARPGPQESNSHFDGICIMFLSCYLLRLQVCLMSTCIQMCPFCSWGCGKQICCVSRSLMFASSLTFRTWSLLLLCFYLRS